MIFHLPLSLMYTLSQTGFLISIPPPTFVIKSMQTLIQWKMSPAAEGIYFNPPQRVFVFVCVPIRWKMKCCEEIALFSGYTCINYFTVGWAFPLTGVYYIAFVGFCTFVWLTIAHQTCSEGKACKLTGFFTLINVTGGAVCVWVGGCVSMWSGRMSEWVGHQQREELQGEK